MSKTLIVPVLLLASLVGACGNQESNGHVEMTMRRAEPIVGGVLDNDTSHDGVVLVAAFAQGGGGMCTGSLISQPGEKGVVVTARHCVTHTVQEYVTCVNDVAGSFDPGSLYVAKGVKPSSMADAIGRGEKLFQPEGASLCGTDIAIIVMQETVSGITPVRVRTEKRTTVGEKFTAIGYGLTNQNNPYSSGQRYRREDVEVTKLGPVGYMGLKSNEFMGTTSICSGDSGGPALSADYAVMGVTSRGAECSGNDNFWSMVEDHVALVDEAIAYAGSRYMDEDGNLHGETGAGGTGGAGGEGEDGGSGGESGDGTGGGVESTVEAGACPQGQTCVEDPDSDVCQCESICQRDEDCLDTGHCDPSQHVCREKSTESDGSPGGGSCAVTSERGLSNGGVVGFLLLVLGLSSTRRRKAWSW